MGYRVKTCLLCDRQNNPVPKDDHDCFHNHEGSAQKMESEIIVQGFLQSFQRHGVIFRYMIGDADSTVLYEVQKAIRYPGHTPVEKVDCINHAVRAVNAKLYALKGNKAFAKKDRDFLGKNLDRYGSNTFHCNIVCKFTLIN